MAHELINRGSEQHSDRLLQVPRSVADHLDGLMEVDTAVWPQIEGAEGSRALLRCIGHDDEGGSLYINGVAFNAGNDRAVQESLVIHGAAQGEGLAERVGRGNIQREWARYLLIQLGDVAAQRWYLLDPPARPNLVYHQLASLSHGVHVPEYTPYFLRNGRPSLAMRCLKTAMEMAGSRGLFKNTVLSAGATALVGMFDERQAAQHA